jgi:hypothetical protein
MSNKEPKKPKRSSKLTLAQQRELCTLIASRLPAPEIIAHFDLTYAIDISSQLIYHYRRSANWSDYISEERILYDLEVSECFLACKRNRMDSLYNSYLMAKDQQDSKGMTMALAQAQREMEGMKLALVDKAGEDFSFTINIGPPPLEELPQKPKELGPVLQLRPPDKDDKEVD